MRFTINSKLLGKKFDFFRPDIDGTSYVYLESERHPGTTGQQICYGGGFAGSTIRSSEESFENDCRRWYRQYKRAMQAVGV